MSTPINFDNIKKLTYEKLIDLYDKDCKEKIEKFSEADASANAREALLYNILGHYIHSGKEVHMSGILETVTTYGFLRDLSINFSPMLYDIHLSTHLIEDMGLKAGDEVFGIVQLPRTNTSKLFTLSKVIKINGLPVKGDKMQRYRRKDFMSLEAIYPEQPIILEQNKNLTGRMIDIVCPIGFGQRMLIVAPPKAGKTTILRDMAHGIVHNHLNESTYLIILLVGERPEEVTTTRREVPSAEVLSSTFDETAEQQIRVAELCMERAKRLAENGKNVILMVDSMSRLVRAYNYIAPSSGKVLSGGVEASSLYKLRSFFGIARNVTGAGSITMIATCLVDTTSRMDSFIFEELKGTGNSEVYLDVKLAESRKFPAIDILTSSTRRPESFLSEIKAKQIHLFMQFVIYGSIQIRKNLESAPSQFNNKTYKTMEKPTLEQAHSILMQYLNNNATNSLLLSSMNKT